ncbi:villin-4-like isoform X3 [Henckelia pumila]|uniref:villin-4-like isoform X3 n=1 Tax=Henckelia pumila TaxID=405737 RepID=UPI003C6DE689
MADANSGEFWGFFGGFAPLPRKTTINECKNTDLTSPKLFCIGNGEAVPVDADSLTRELLDSYKCYMVDCGAEAFVWMGKNTSLTASKTVDAGMSLREFRSSAEWFTLGFSASLLSSAMPTPTILITGLELNYREQTNSMHLIRLGLNFS